MLKKLGKTISNVLLLLALVFTSANIQDIHERLLILRAGSGVVRLTNEAGTSGGTGFHVQAPSGHTYILTNAHVCGLGQDDGFMYVARDNYEEKLKRRIISISGFTDLCLVEPLPGYSGLSVAGSPPFNQQEVYAIGHPMLYPLTLSKGRITAWDPEIAVVDHIIIDQADEDSCKAPKNQIRTVETLFGKLQLCLIVIPAYITSVPTFPGNSGSPVVDKLGHLVGVVFAGDGMAHWGIFVTHDDIVKFLQYY